MKGVIAAEVKGGRPRHNIAFAAALFMVQLCLLPGMAMPDRETTVEAGVASPCTRVCVVHPRLKLCVGCGRSLDEIAGWMAFAPAERALVMAALPSRLALMRRADAARRMA